MKIKVAWPEYDDLIEDVESAYLQRSTGAPPYVAVKMENGDQIFLQGWYVVRLIKEDDLK